MIYGPDDKPIVNPVVKGDGPDVPEGMVAVESPDGTPIFVRVDTRNRAQASRLVRRRLK